MTNTMIVVAKHWKGLSLALKFGVASSLILLLGMLGLGWSTGQTIEDDVMRSTGDTAALYITSFIEPHMQELSGQDSLSLQAIEKLNNATINTALGKEVVSIKIWSRQGKVVYSSQGALTGKTFVPDDSLALALKGETTAEISQLSEDENTLERAMGENLLEIYSPLHQPGTGKVIGAVEFYERAETLANSISLAKFNSWRNVALSSLVSFFLLFGIVLGGSRTITKQQLQLESRVGQLTNLLTRNRELGARIHEASNRATELNEQFLRRIRSDLHDGPAQGIGFALVSFEALQKELDEKKLGKESANILGKVRGSLEDSLKEIRDLCGGMALPELDDLTLPQTVRRVVRAHEGRTETQVQLEIGDIPEQSSLSLKIGVYRFIQEGLTNAFRHGGGKNQLVELTTHGHDIEVTVSDQGGGFDTETSEIDGHHAGLMGMRKRVESMGGTFSLVGKVNGGARVSGIFPMIYEATAFG
jgi:signal transduction histidine kinase